MTAREKALYVVTFLFIAVMGTVCLGDSLGWW